MESSSFLPKLLNQSVAIGKVIQNAVVFDFKNWLVSPMNSDSLPQSIAHIIDLLLAQQIDYVLVGGVIDIWHC